MGDNSVKDLFGDKEQIAIGRMKAFEPSEGYHLAFSGGKDSIVLLHLAKRAGIKYDAHFNVTSVDPPELMRFIKKEYPEVKWDKPAMTMFQIIRQRAFPTSKCRVCCEILKERGGEGRRILTGIRWAESRKRSLRKPEKFPKAGDGAAWVEHCRTGKGTTYVHPIIDWSDEEVWQYIRNYKVPYCCLYDEGWKRMGCIMCPQGRPAKMRKEAARWPHAAAAYQRAFRYLWESKHEERPFYQKFKDGDDMFDWWLERGRWAKKEMEDYDGEELFDDEPDGTGDYSSADGRDGGDEISEQVDG